MFDNRGYFCCARGQRAYDRGNTNICAEKNWMKRVGDVELELVKEGIGMFMISPELWN